MSLSVVGRVCGRGRGSISGRLLIVTCDITDPAEKRCTAQFEYVEGDDEEIHRRRAEGWTRTAANPSRHRCPAHSAVTP